MSSGQNESEPILRDVPPHLPACTAESLAELYPDEEKPEGMTDWTWYELKFMNCAEGCPRAQAAIDHGRKLAKEHGW